MAQKTMNQAITNALQTELKNDENLLRICVGVGKNGVVYRTTGRIQAESGEERVFDTPIAESEIGGLAIVLAIELYRPVPEIQCFGFVYALMDSINGQMSRMR